MNPGGLVSEEHYEGGLAVVNGHSYADQKLRTHKMCIRDSAWLSALWNVRSIWVGCLLLIAIIPLMVRTSRE